MDWCPALPLTLRLWPRLDSLDLGPSADGTAGRHRSVVRYPNFGVSSKNPLTTSSATNDAVDALDSLPTSNQRRTDDPVLALYSACGDLRARLLVHQPKYVALTGNALERWRQWYRPPDRYSKFVRYIRKQTTDWVKGKT